MRKGSVARRAAALIAAFIIANALALLLSQVSINRRMTRELTRNCMDIAEYFTLIMEHYERSFLFFEELTMEQLSASADPDEVLAFLKREDSRLAAIEGESFDGIYMYYRGRYLYSWDTPFTVYEESGYDATKRPWYIGAVDAAGEMYYASPYPSYANDYMLSTLSRLQPDGQTVFAYDIKLGEIQEYVGRLDIFDRSISLVVDERGMILGASEPLYLGGELDRDNAELREIARLAAAEAGMDQKSIYRAQSTAAFADFQQEQSAFLKKIREKPGELMFDSERLCWGWGYQEDRFIHLVLMPLWPTLNNMIDVLLIALLSANSIVIISYLVIRRHAKTVELAVAYRDLSLSQKKLGELNAELQSAVSAERKLKDMVQMLYDYRPLRDILYDMLYELGTYVQADRASIYRLGGNRVICSHAWCQPRVVKDRRVLATYALSALENWLPSLRAGESVYYSDIKALSGTKIFELCVLAGVHSLVVAPLFVDGKLYGYMSVNNPPPARVDKINSLMITLAYSVAAAILREQNRLQLESASYTDSMTEVGNRNAFIRDSEALSRKAKGGETCAIGVMYCDLNGLKKTNDDLGHEAGDLLIIGLADSLRHFFRDTDIYRTGGDEFVVLCPGMSEEMFRERARRAEAYLMEEREISAAFGAVWRPDSRSLDQAVRDADKLMYDAKTKLREETQNEE